MGRRRRKAFKTFLPVAGLLLVLSSLAVLAVFLMFYKYNLRPWIYGSLFTSTIYGIGMIVFGVYTVRSR